MSVICAPTAFARSDSELLKHGAGDDAPFPRGTFTGSCRPGGIGRIYDSRLAEQVLGFRCRTGFARALEALRIRYRLPFGHDPDYVSPAVLLTEAQPGTRLVF